MRAGPAITALAIACAALGSAETAQAKASGPNLQLTGAKLTLAAAQASGAVTVRNTGNRTAGRSKLALFAGGQTVVRVETRRLRPKRHQRVRLAAATGSLAPGRHKLKLCADATHRVKERREKDNCRSVGVIDIPLPSAPSSVPTNPVPFIAGQRSYLSDAGGYWFWVPPSYDATHQTPFKLFIWLHGCSGQSYWDIVNVAPQANGNYIAVAPDGTEGGCWDMNADSARVINVIDAIATHFNIDRKRVVLGGYSSGADLSYRTAFFNSTKIAGILVENATPFKDIGVSAGAALAAASFKFQTVQLAHTGDVTYTIDLVRNEVATLAAAGFPVTLIERPGNHWDDDGPGVGTVYDMRTLLLPYLDVDWTSPGA